MNRDYVADWLEMSPAEKKAWIVWLEYYELTERFDRELPGIMARDTWVPRYDVRVLCSRHASVQLEATHWKLLGVDKEVSDRVRRHCSEMAYDAQISLLARMRQEASR